MSYPTRHLGRNGPKVSAIGLGAMGVYAKTIKHDGLHSNPSGLGGAFYGAADEAQVFQMLSRAADTGITFWDTADVYGDSCVSRLRCELSDLTRYQAKLLSENGSGAPGDAGIFSCPPSSVRKTLLRTRRIFGARTASRVTSSDASKPRWPLWIPTRKARMKRSASEATSTCTSNTVSTPIRQLNVRIS